MSFLLVFFFFQAEDGIRDDLVTGVQTCALPILARDKEITVTDEGRRRALLRKKDLKNLGTIALLLLSRWLYTACVLLAASLAFMYFPAPGIASTLAGVVFFAALSILDFVLTERVSLAPGGLRSCVVSMS